MTYRRPKSITTDYRPPAAGRTSPVGSGNAQPRAAAWQDPTRASHDKAVATLSDSTVLAAAQDLGKRRATGRDPESRWIADRLAALARCIDRRGLNRKSA